MKGGKSMIHEKMSKVFKMGKGRGSDRNSQSLSEIPIMPDYTIKKGVNLKLESNKKA